MDGVEALRAEGAVQALTALEREPGFGGLRIDDDGTVEVSFTTDLPASARALVEACPVPVRLRRVEHTWADLLRWTDTLGRRHEHLRRAGVELFVVTPDVAANRVLVEVRRRTADVDRVLVEAVPGAPLTVSGAQAAPDHPPVCDAHFPLGPMTMAARPCPECGARTNSRYVRCPDCARRAGTCVLCGEPAVHGLHAGA